MFNSDGRVIKEPKSYFIQLILFLIVIVVMNSEKFSTADKLQQLSNNYNSRQ